MKNGLAGFPVILYGAYASFRHRERLKEFFGKTKHGVLLIGIPQESTKLDADTVYLTIMSPKEIETWVNENSAYSLVDYQTLPEEFQRPVSKGIR